MIKLQNSRWGKYVPASKCRTIIEKFEEPEGNIQNKINETLPATYWEVWICYDDCPASGVLAGYITNTEEQLIFVTENGNYKISEGGIIDEWNYISKILNRN